MSRPCWGPRAVPPRCQRAAMRKKRGAICMWNEWWSEESTRQMRRHVVMRWMLIYQKIREIPLTMNCHTGTMMRGHRETVPNIAIR